MADKFDEYKEKVEALSMEISEICHNHEPRIVITACTHVVRYAISAHFANPKHLYLDCANLFYELAHEEDDFPDSIQDAIENN